MTDPRDLEIARLRGQLEATQRPRRSVVATTLIVLGTVAAVGIGLFVLLVALGSSLPEGYRFEDECRAAVAAYDGREGAVEACMRELERVYIGPDRSENRRNAADLWAREYYVPAA